jgi:hypothetical protein
VAWTILTVYYVDDDRSFRTQSFSSDGRQVFPADPNYDGDVGTWPTINGIYRIVYFLLIEPPSAEFPHPLLVLDVVESTLAFSRNEGIRIVAWIYSPLAQKEYGSAQTAPWETTINVVRTPDRPPGTAALAPRPDYTRIKMWNQLDLLGNVPVFARNDPWADRLWRFLNGDRVARGAVSVMPDFSFSQQLGIPWYFRDWLDLDDLKTIGLNPTCTSPLWITRAFFVKAATLLDEGPSGARSYFVIVFRLAGPAGCGPVKFNAFGENVQLSLNRDAWVLLHRPASTIRADAPDVSSGLVQPSVLHLFRVRGDGVVALWNTWAKAYQQALWSVSGGQPSSFLPTFQAEEAEKSEWVMTYRVNAYLDDFKLNPNFSFPGSFPANGFQNGVDRKAARNHFDPGPYADQPPPAQPAPEPRAGVVFQPLSLHLQTPEPGDPGVGPLELLRVFDVYGAAISPLELTVVPTAAQASNAGQAGQLRQAETDFGVVLNYVRAATLPGDPRKTRLVRMGSLDLAIGGSAGGHPESDTNRIALRREQNITCVDLDAMFVVSELLPGGQDDIAGEEYVPENSSTFGANPCTTVPGGKDSDSDLNQKIDSRFRRKRPLVIHVDPSTNSSGLYTLHVKESVVPGKTRSLSLNLYSQQSTLPAVSSQDMCDRTDLRRVFVLDSNPFLVAEVLYAPFENAEQEKGSIIATWTNSNPEQGPVWMLQLNQDPFCLVMPPQAVGEEMVKNQPLDRPDFPAAGDTARPRPSALPFRLSGNARITVDPRKQVTSFAEAPWNLRRILGTPQDPQPGPLVNRVQYELLYGLSCDATQPAFRLADLFARVGQIAGQRVPKMAWSSTPTQNDAYNAARLDWAEVYRTYLSRIAVLEAWSGIVNSPASSVSVKAGLSCVIRPGADLANPITPESNRLRGGVTWGFESLNIYNQVTNQSHRADVPTSTAATLDGFSISSLGGWGKQTADFGLTNVFADVEMGRTSTYKLTRIGRIAVWWVLARHVIVYRRSVTPSRQFFSEQPQYKGWPVPRKVEEYVEILEDSRAYPDNAGLADPAAISAAKQACGPIKSILLKKGMRFNVDSAWGADVNRPNEATGWKVPLWTPGAWPADVYPKPDVGIGAVVADGTSGVKLPPVCDNPENLFFFTLTGLMQNGKMEEKVDLDPHKWPAISDIDYVNAPIAAAPKDFDNGDLRETVPKPAVVPAAFGPCTFRLRPGAAPTNLVADRATKQMAVVLDSITVSRAVATAATAVSRDVAAVKNVQDQAANLYSAVLRALPRDASLPLDQNIWNSLTAAASSPVTTVTNAIAGAASRFSAAEQKIKTTATDFEATLRANFKKSITDGCASVLKDYSDYVNSVTATTFSADSAKQFLATIQRNFEEVLLFPTSTPGSLLAMVGHFVDAATTIQSVVTTAVNALNADIAQWQNVKDAAVRRMTSAVNQAISTADALKTLRRPVESLPDLYTWANFVKPQTQNGKIQLGKLGVLVVNLEPACQKLLDDLGKATSTAEAAAARDAFAASDFFKSIGQNWPQPLIDLVNSALPAGQTVSSLDEIYRVVRQTAVWVQGSPGSAAAGQVALWGARIQAISTSINTFADLQASLPLPSVQNSSSVNLTDYLNNTVPAAVQTLLDKVKVQTDAVAGLFQQETTLASTRLQQSVTDLQTDLAKWVMDSVDPQATKAFTTVDALRQEIEKRRDDLSRQAEAYLDKGFRQLTDSTAYQIADATFRLVRAFGAPPQVPNLGFDRDKVAYIFNQLEPHVDLTPVLARVAQANQAFDDLKTLGATIPTVGALEQLIPTSFKGFSLSDIFGNFAGLNLANLFPGLKLPELDNKAVQISHDFDPQTLRATVNAVVNFTIANNSTLFTIGPVKVDVLTAKFSANASLTADPKGIVRRTASGTISGEWQLSLSGTPLVILQQTDLNFDDSGSIKFSVKPQNVKMPGALEVVTKLLNTFVSPDSGLSFGTLPDGFQAILALPVPDLQGVTSGFSNLKLGALFAIEVANGFTMSVGFSLASREAPFSLTIFVLGGGGYVSARALFNPASLKLNCQVDMAITASASLAISLAVISGGVYVYFGATASYNTDGQGLSFGVMFLIRGEVSVLGIVSASISLLLEATYSGGTLVGHGQLSIKIKICWCFTLEVNEGVTYTLGKQGNQGAAEIRRLSGPLLAAVAPVATNAYSDLPFDPVAAGVPPDIFEVRAAEYVAMLV